MDESAGVAGLGPRRTLVGWVLAVVGLVGLTGLLLAVDAAGSATALEAML